MLIIEKRVSTISKHANINNDSHGKAQVGSDNNNFSVSLGGLLSASPNLACVCSINCNYLEINPAFSDIFGFEESNYIGNSFYNFIGDDGELGFTKVLVSEAIKNKKNISFTNHYRCKDKTYKQIEWQLFGNNDYTFYLTGKPVVQNIKKLKETLLLSLMKSINLSKDFNSALELVLSSICESTGWQIGEVWLPNQTNTHLECKFAWSAQSDKLQKFKDSSLEYTFLLNQGLPGCVWHSNAPEWEGNVSRLSQEEFPRVNIAQECGIKAGFGIPISANGNVLAVLEFFTNEFKNEDLQLIEFISSIASQLSLIIQRKKTEEQLEESKLLLEKAQSLTQMGHWKYVPALKKINGSKEFYNIYELPQLEMSLISFMKLLHPDDFRRNAELIKSGILHGASWDVEYRIILKSGQEKWIRSIGEPSFDAKGNYVCLIGTNQDISERKYRELESKRLNTAIDQSPTSVIITNKDGIIEFVNPAVSRTTGYSADELIGQNTRLMQSGKTDKEVIKELWETVLAGNTWSGNLLNKKKNGELFWEKTMISAVKNEQNEIINMIAVKEDITKRKLAEKQIQTLNEELEQKVIDRTAKLDETLLELRFENDERKRAQHSLIKANDTKDKFFSILGHDLKNPLQALLSYTSIMRLSFERGDLASISKYIERIEDSALNLNSLLDEVLTWARSQSNKIEYMPENVNMYELSEKIISLLKNSSQAKNIKVSLNMPTDKQSYCDKNMISTIIRNLVSNAIKFTPNGGEINVSCTKRNDVCNYIVQDTGVGIEQSKLDEIFDFSTHYSTTGTKGETGTGLGLTLCKDFVEKHNGTIWAESELGVGSSFIFTLPIERVDDIVTISS